MYDRQGKLVWEFMALRLRKLLVRAERATFRCSRLQSKARKVLTIDEAKFNQHFD
jgi:hypothetical protein